MLEWWESGEIVRATFTMDKTAPIEFLWKDGTLRSMIKNPRPNDKAFVSGGISSGPGVETGYNLWCYSLFQLPNGAKTPVSDLLQKPALQTIQPGEGSSKKRLYKVRFKLTGSLEGDIWFDEGHNFLATKLVLLGEPSLEHEVTSFAEIKPGIFFPKVVEVRMRQKGELRRLMTKHFNIVRINEHIDERVFQLTFPPGTSVGDETKGVTYVTGEGEIPATEPSPLPPPMHESLDYPTGHRRPSTTGIALASVVVIILVLGIVGWLVRSRLKKR
jgi:hypothetical protein